MQAAQEALQDPSINSYGPADGYPPLVAALQHKLAHQNGLAQVSSTSASIKKPAICGDLPCSLSPKRDHTEPAVSWQVDYEVMVTSGANQAFTNLVVSLLDAGDRCVLWAPLLL